MKSAWQYVRTLRERRPAAVARELRSRFLREPVPGSIRRLMDVCERHHGRFTFFLVGLCAERNPDVLREIVDRGHEVACHGHTHERYDLCGLEAITASLERTREIFWRIARYEAVGFRAPYLRMAPHVVEALGKLGFRYSSSVLGHRRPEGFTYDNGVRELPIHVCDWGTLIRDNRGLAGMADAMRAGDRPGSTFLLHPMRMGQRAHAEVVEAYAARTTLPLVTAAELANGRPGVALTGDVGEMSLRELFTGLAWR